MLSFIVQTHYSSVDPSRLLVAAPGIGQAVEFPEYVRVRALPPAGVHSQRNGPQPDLTGSANSLTHS